MSYLVSQGQSPVGKFSRSCMILRPVPPTRHCCRRLLSSQDCPHLGQDGSCQYGMLWKGSFFPLGSHSLPGDLQVHSWNPFGVTRRPCYDQLLFGERGCGHPYRKCSSFSGVTFTRNPQPLPKDQGVFPPVTKAVGPNLPLYCPPFPCPARGFT